MDRKRQSNDCQARNRIQVLNRIIERPALEQRLVDVREGAAEQNGVTVRTGAGDRGGTQRTAAAADVFDNHRAEQRFDLFHPWPGEGVERATRWKWNHEPDRPRRIGLRPSDAGCGRKRGSARCQMQKISAGKFHFEPPLRPFPSIGYRVYVFAPTGRRAVNTEPLPGSLFTVTSQPIIRASLRAMARPRPVPPKRCAVAASAWLNSSNSLAFCSAVMPMPVSETANSTKLLPLLTLRAASLTSPALVNLQALLNRLSSICRSRMGSTVNAPRFSWASTTSRFLFCSASCPAVPMTSLISAASCTVCGLSSSFPASIFDRSSTWLMRPSR